MALAFVRAAAARELRVVGGQTLPLRIDVADPGDVDGGVATVCLLGVCSVVAKKRAKDGICAYLICPGFVKTPLVEPQIPGLSRRLGIAPKAVVIGRLPEKRR